MHTLRAIATLAFAVALDATAQPLPEPHLGSQPQETAEPPAPR